MTRYLLKNESEGQRGFSRDDGSTYLLAGNAGGAVVELSDDEAKAAKGVGFKLTKADDPEGLSQSFNRPAAGQIDPNAPDKDPDGGSRKSKAKADDDDDDDKRVTRPVVRPAAPVKTAETPRKDS